MVLELKGLEQLIRDCIKSEMANYKPSPPPKKPEFISRRKAALILGVSLPTLHNYCKDGTISSYRMGAKILLIEEEVIKSVQMKKMNWQKKFE
jgi:excisionase family DNA binding protein